MISKICENRIHKFAVILQTKNELQIFLFERKAEDMEQRLSILTLGVEDLNTARAFYENLGWKVATESDTTNIVAFNLQSFVLVLYPKDGLAKDTGLDVHSLSAPSFTLAYNVASTAEVDRVIEEVRKVGARVVKEPQTVFWGGYSGYFADRDGYLWEVAYNPYAKLDKDGSFKWV